MATTSKPTIQVKHSATPDESRPFVTHGHAEMHKLGRGIAMRGVFAPGWKWSEHVRPIAGTPSCQASHVGYVMSGRMRIRADDGTEAEIAPGDFFEIQPGHDAWVVGSETCVLIDFGGYEQYAREQPSPQRSAAKEAERPSAPSR